VLARRTVAEWPRVGLVTSPVITILYLNTKDKQLERKKVKLLPKPKRKIHIQSSPLNRKVDARTT
jgi:hypothetical protein